MRVDMCRCVLVRVVVLTGGWRVPGGLLGYAGIRWRKVLSYSHGTPQAERSALRICGCQTCSGIGFPLIPPRVTMRPAQKVPLSASVLALVPARIVRLPAADRCHSSLLAATAATATIATIATIAPPMPLLPIAAAAEMSIIAILLLSLAAILHC